ncbi:hypothetical protein CVT24_007483 [Panaeolus cyanescens]|uniref:Uncharacterized protein n=1 Tax=Panaeolus cyanescens TaxID=181874 RepID=A0A409YWJ2_9AGAR|nr:hypothetical protein CVT24_007483 [Panaeolus cyanescens]
MPPKRGRPSARQQTQKSNLVRCDCDLCNGEMIPESTRTAHRRDRRDAQQESTLLAQQSTASHPGQYPQFPPTEWLKDLGEELLDLSTTPIVHPDVPLVFVNPPDSSMPFEFNVDAELLRPNDGRFLLSNHPSNAHFLHVQTRLAGIYHTLRSLDEGDLEKQEDFMSFARSSMSRLLEEKHIQWSNQQRIGTPRHNVNTEIFFYRGRPRSKAHRCAVLVSLVLKHLYATPLRAIRVQLAGLKSLLRSVNLPQDEINQLPRDPRSITTYFHLHPITRQYVCCPQCNFLYLWDGKSQDSVAPSHCSYKPAVDDPVCRAELWKTRRGRGNRSYQVPVKVFTYQPLKFWLGRLLSRPDIEEHIEKLQRSGPRPDGILDDIWGSPCFQSLKGKDGQPFLPGPEDEGRLIFGLAIDSFDPTHVTAAGQSLSSTGIWLVLLNLPPHLRYLHENMYVAGVIPGPEKPSTEEINHYVDLVVEDFLEIFDPGVYLSRTHKYRLGRLYKAMLIPLICDMLAARQVIGQPSSPSAHSFCTVCDLDQDDIDIVDRTEWPFKNIQHVRRYATMWKDARTSADRKRLFDGYSVRWSPLLRLPYWDPARFTVIDAMHTLDLGLFSNHCRVLFALNAEAPSGDGTSSVQSANTIKRVYTKAHISAYRRCIDIVTKKRPSIEQELLELDRKVLYTFCEDNRIIPEGHNIVVGTKPVLAANIIRWRDGPTYSQPRSDITELLKEQARSSVEPDRETTPDVQGDVLKNLLPTIKLLLLPTQENIEKLPKVATKALYVQICDLLNISYSHIDLRRRAAKRELQDHILEKISGDEELSLRLSELLPKSNQRVVLGKEIMQMVWSDMKNTITPTWVATAPPNWGTKQRGKLSAAQWRVICTIHLPITLIRLWSGEQGRKRLMLDHFMDLVCAVRIANMKTSSREHVEAYDKHITRYVSNIRHIYPDQKLKPTHHCALHIGEFLQDLGPVHSHDSPFFERHINAFHHLNHNSHPGEMETTHLNSSACSANVRGRLADEEDIRPLVFDMIEAMTKIDKEDIRGFRLASVLDPYTPTTTTGLKAIHLELSELRQTLWKTCLASRGEPENIVTGSVSSFQQIALRGVCYSVSDHVYRNSIIMFSERVNGSPSPSPVEYQNLKAAFIDVIFQPPDQQNLFYLVIRELLPVVETDQLRDPYRRYGFASGFLCRRQHQHIWVIGLDQVKSHAAFTPTSIDGFGDVYHVLCVDRMMNMFSTFDYDP